MIKNMMMNLIKKNYAKEEKINQIKKQIFFLKKLKS